MTDDIEEENRWGSIPGSDDLNNLDFDFEDYFKRHSAGTLSEEEMMAFPARTYGLFCSAYYKSGGDPAAIPKWVASYVADRLFEGLQGLPWGDVMRLPWDEQTHWLNPKGQRAMSIYTSIENKKNAEPESNTTDLIAWQAGENNVSYETARADYYAIKKAIDWKTGIPAKFLNPIPEN